MRIYILDGTRPPKFKVIQIQGQPDKNKVEEKLKDKIPGYALWHYFWGWSWIPQEASDGRERV